MYWKSDDYEAITQTVIDIYRDYGINTFPIDEKEICRRLGIKLIPYSDVPDYVKENYEDAFYIPTTSENPPTIFFNDLVVNKGRRRYSIFHELKHYVCGDTDETEYNVNSFLITFLKRAKK